MTARPTAAALALAALIAVGSAVGGCSVGSFGTDATTNDSSTIAPPITKLAVVTDGAVRVDAADPGTPGGIERTVHHPTGSQVPPLSVTSAPDGTRVDGRCGDDCSADLVLRVPRDTPVDVRTSAGEVRVAGMGTAALHVASGEIDARDIAGDLTAETQSGAVTANGVAGRTAASSRAGSVTVENTGGPVEASSTAGSVDATLNRPGDVSAESNAGAVTISVPRGDYRVDAAGLGQTESGVANTPGAPHLIHARTSAGQVRIQTLGG